MKQILLLLTVFLPVFSIALPQINNVVTGEAEVNLDSQRMEIQQQSDFLHMQFDHLNVNAGEIVHFSQDAQDWAIAESLSQDPTQIYGQLSGDAGLFVVSPSGLVVHDGGMLDAGALMLGVGDLNIKSGSEFSYQATKDSLINRGVISGGSVTIFSQDFNNQNLIRGDGNVSIDAGEEILVSFAGENVHFAVEEKALTALVQNHGSLIAEGGNINISAEVKQNLHALTIHNTGSIKATQVVEKGGDIFLLGGEGDIENEGLIVSENGNHDGSGGSITLHANRIANFSNIHADANGVGIGGKIILEADEVVTLLPESIITANADVAGGGGFIKVFSPNTAMFSRTSKIEARAGLLLGDGGFVDVSGWETVLAQGMVDTGAINGANGTYLIDPYNVTISAGATANETFSSNVYTPSSSGAIINVTDLQNNLKLGNVQVVTSGGGAESGDIAVSVAIDLDGTNGNTLHLLADGSIQLNGDIADGNTGTADQTNVILQAQSGSITGANVVRTGGGNLILIGQGNITFGTGGTFDPSQFDSEGGLLSVEAPSGTLSLVSDIDINGMAGQNLNLFSNGNLNLDFNILDTATGSVDNVNLLFRTTSGVVNVAAGKTMSSYGGSITVQYDTGAMNVGSAGDYEFLDFQSGLGLFKAETLAGDMAISSVVDLDGTNFGIVQFASGNNLNVSADIADQATGSADATSLVLQASANLTMTDGVIVDSGGGVVTLSAIGDLSLSNLVTDGGNAYIIATGDVLDAGDAGTSYDLNTNGGVAFFSVNGSIGTGWGSALEVADTHFDFDFNGTNQTAYIDAGLSTAELEITALDFESAGGLDFNMRSTNGADIRISGDMADSNTGSVESATFNLSTNLVGGDIIINDGASIHSEGGDITLLAGGGMWLSEVWSAGGDINLTATNMIDNGNSASDINSGGTGVVTLNLSGDFGGTSSATAIEVNNAILDFNASGINQNFYLRTDSNQDIAIRNFDFNGTGAFTFNYDRTGSGDIRFTGLFADSAGGDDVSTINVRTDDVSSYIIVNNGATLNSNGGAIDLVTLGNSSNINIQDGGGVISGAADVTINAAGNINLTNIISGGDVHLTGVQINDFGASATDIVTSGGVINITASGDVGGTSSLTGLDVENSTINFTAAGTNQNLFINGYGATPLVINDVDYNGSSTFNMGFIHAGAGDIQITGAITDSATGSADSATMSFNTSVGNIIGVDGATIRSYGGDITYDSASQLGIVRTKTDGGQLNITATEVYDNGNTGPDIETLGGNIVFNVVGDIGVSGNGSLELRDSIVTGSVGSNNATWDFRAYAATNYNSIGNIDIDGGNGFSLFLHNNNGGQVNVVGNIEDSNTATADQANISLQTLIAGDDIIMDSTSQLSSYGGTIALNSADQIGLSETLSGGGDITITAVGDIYDNRPNGNEISSSGGVVTINAGANVGGVSFDDAVEIYSSILDVNFSNPNQSVWLNVGKTDDSLTIRDVDFNGADSSQFNVRGQNGSDLIVSGQLYDSDTAVQDNVTVNLITTTNTGDITINDGATIRVGNGDLTLNSGNDLYLTGILGGSVSNLIAANNIIDNGSITLDIDTSGVVNMSAGGSVGLVGTDTVFDFSGGTYNMTMGSGDWDIIASGVVNLNNIEIDGANGSQLKFITTSDLNLTGVMSDANGSDDRVNLFLGASAPGFIVFPDAGYTVLGSLTFWNGTSGIRDGTDERINLTADDVIISGNSFLNNTGPIIMDLTVDRLDISHTSSTVEFEINNSKNLQLLPLDGDSVALSGKSFKFNVNGSLIVPSLGLRNVEDQLWIIADDFDDPDGDNIVSVFDSSGDADGDLNLIFEINGANSIQVNTDATFIDGSLVAGAEMVIDSRAPELNLGNDLNTDGLFVSGDGNWTFLSSNTVRLAESGLATTGGYHFEVGDLLDSDADLALIGNQIYVELTAPSFTRYQFALNASEFDAAGIDSIDISQGSNLGLSDVNGDGLLFDGVQNLTANIGGRLTFWDAGLQLSGQINITAFDAVDSDAVINLSANQLFLDFTSPNESNYSFVGSISQFNADVAAGLQVQSSIDLSVLDWNGSGSVLNGATGLDLQSTGRLSIPSSGLSSTSFLWLTGDEVQDGDFNLVGLNTPQLMINSNMRNNNLTLSGSFSELDVSLSGAGANLVLNHGQALDVLDVNNDGVSLEILDGFAALTVAGDVSLSGAINLVDTNANGSVGGYMYLQYEGNALFGVSSALQLSLDGGGDAGRDAGFGMGEYRLFVQQTAAANSANLMAFSNVDIQVLGGDAYFDISNGGSVEGFGSINMASNASISALNSVGEQVTPHPGYTDLDLQGTLSVGAGRQIVFNGYTLDEEIPLEPEVPDVEEIEDQIDQGVSDAINDSVEDGSQVVVDEIQEETVSAVESSPNVNFALNEMFSDCREGDARDTRCKVKEEISRFLGRFLIGGSMPKTVR